MPRLRGFFILKPVRIFFRMNYTFIINPNSGNNRKKSIIKNYLRQHTSKNITIIFTKYPGHASEIAKLELHKGIQNIIAVGGDGTVNEVAGQLVNSRANFGLIPMGSGNGFARSLNIPLNTKLAFDTIFKLNLKKIDVGKVNDRFFFSVAGVGLDAHIALRFQTGRLRGPLPYFLAGVKEYLKYPYPEFNLKNAKDILVKPLIITIANGAQFGNGAKIAPQADMQDGLFDVCLIEKLSLLKAINAASKMFSGKLHRLSEYSAFKSGKIEIISQSSGIKYHIDGEPFIGKNNLQFEILPLALNVLTI